MTGTLIDISSVSGGKTKSSEINSSTVTGNGVYPLTLDYSDGLEYASSSSTLNLVTKPFSFQKLSDWRWAKMASSTITDQRDIEIRSVTFSNPTRTIDTCMTGKGKLVILRNPIPVDKNNFEMYVMLRSSGSNNVIMLGEYATTNGEYDRTSNTLVVKLNDIGVNSSSYVTVTLSFTDGVCTITGLNGKTSTKSFTSYEGLFYLMFYSAGQGTQYVARISWNYGNTP